jgi:hypothetical protein
MIELRQLLHTTVRTCKDSTDRLSSKVRSSGDCFWGGGAASHTKIPPPHPPMFYLLGGLDRPSSRPFGLQGGQEPSPSRPRVLGGFLGESCWGVRTHPKPPSRPSGGSRPRVGVDSRLLVINRLLQDFFLRSRQSLDENLGSRQFGQLLKP